MRLWHQDLISKLPRQQLLGQHRECCALRGNGWGKRHATVNYVFNYDRGRLVSYHSLIMQEMIERGYKVNPEWFDASYCGQNHPRIPTHRYATFNIIYPEHNREYLHECLANLESKGIVLT